MTIDCNDEWFKSEIMELSEDNEGSVAVRILKLYDDAEEVERSESVLRCRGEAKLSRGGDSYITYHIEIDRDGDLFIGYEIGDLIRQPTPNPTATPQPTATPEPVVLGDRALPVPLGVTAEVKFSPVDHWEITVLDTRPNATAYVLSEAEWVDPPADGNQFYVATIRTKYLGPDSSAFSTYRLKVVGDSAVVSDQSLTCSVGLEISGIGLSTPEIFTGGQVEGNMCWEIAASDEESLVLIVDSDFSFLDRERIWFALQDDS